MPRYRYDAPFPAVAFGLQHGPDLTVTRDGVPLTGLDGQTVELQPGDLIDTDEPMYPRPGLVQLAAPTDPTPTAVPTEPAGATQ